jgi:hypothetical protein
MLTLQWAGKPIWQHSWQHSAKFDEYATYGSREPLLLAIRWLRESLTAWGEALQSGRTCNSATLGTWLATKSPQAGPLLNIQS